MVKSHRPSGPYAPGTNPLRVVVVDDHPVFRRGLVDTLKSESGITVCGEASSVETALATIGTTKPDVAIVDLSLGGENGLTLISAIAKSHPAVRVLVVSGYDETIHADRALKCGAHGYIMKDKAASELVVAVRRVAAGQTYASPATVDRILQTMAARRSSDRPPSVDCLSDRERHVLTLMGRGMTTREIAQMLDVSVKTVESHYAHMKEKLGLKNGRALMRMAVSWTEQSPV